ncbi:hypothetical protein TUN199_11601 [Pyrenophora tritici-repentis]|nr:hypothetical protein PtrV1_13890 [Pyrenophora tritici-repentis]KAI0569125.1 hypothetical protein Alg215_11819 [Pyrenophora tritici-repentis]KAI0569317.1 hypothetical protein Alg130_11695 [Pyrenophora tritici-repentis]KAI0604127.1 hypothetical protein TUN205_11626 [Pyrenophora tritici-repentis]KAI0616407.1 hypothetical protein TUN199_11601 [Pyrenophora tritici-repentis]
MLFNFTEYKERCSQMSLEELRREWNHYTRLITGSATSTTLSGLAALPTAGISLIGVIIGSTGIYNAQKKRAIIDYYLARYEEQHKTRKRDVIGSMAFSGTLGVATLGIGSMGAEAALTEGICHGIFAQTAETEVKVVTHVIADGVGLAIEHKYHNDLKAKAEKNA